MRSLRFRFSVLVVVLALALGFGSVHVNAMQCDYAENSSGVYDEDYGYYCAGTGEGCSYCWDEVVVVG